LLISLRLTFFQPSSRRLIRSLQSSNTVDLKFTIVFSCPDETTCDTIEAGMPTIYQGLIGSIDTMLQNQVIVSCIQEVAADKGLQTLNSISTNSALVYPQTSARRRLSTIPALEVGSILGLSSSISLPINATINNVTLPNNATHEDDMMTVVEKTIEECLFNYTFDLPDGFDLVVDHHSDAIFDNLDNSMTNCFEMTLIFPCVSISDCAIQSNTAELEMYRLVIDLRGKASSGNFGSAVVDQATTDNVPGFATSASDEVVYPSKSGSDLAYEWGPVEVARQFSILAATLCISNFTKPTNSSSETLLMEQTLATAIQNTLPVVIANLPVNVNFTVEVTELNYTSTKLNNKVDFVFDFLCDADPLTPTEDCDDLHTDLVTNHVNPLINTMLTAIDNGQLASMLRSIAVANNAIGYQNAAIPDDCFIYPVVSIPAPTPKPIVGIAVNPIVISIFNQFSVTACQCDVFLNCNFPPNPVKQNEVFQICVTPSSGDVTIGNLEMTITGDDNGFEYSPVTYGSSSWVPSEPISQAFLVQDSVLVRTLLVGGFFNLNGGTSTVSVEGNAMLEFDSNKVGRKLETSTSNFNLKMNLNLEQDIVEDVIEPTNRFVVCLAKIVEIVQRIMKRVGF